MYENSFWGNIMITLNDYLYNGDTVLKIIHSYENDLRQSAEDAHNEIDLLHCEFLQQLIDLLEHNDFLTSQSQRIREFYKYMAAEYPSLAFTFKGRIKSLIRAESKFNGNIVEFITQYYEEKKTFPSLDEVKKRLNCFRDLIAYRIVISLPKCHLAPGMDLETEELNYLYEIAGKLPDFLKDRGFYPEPSGLAHPLKNSRLTDNVSTFYRDYVTNPNPFGYRSLHITFYDTISRSYVELQLRTKQMDDHAEIGPANHLGYEKRQHSQRSQTDTVPSGECLIFDQARTRVQELAQIDLAKLDVNMFAARDNSLINDGCGLFRGRQILPFEHLSRFQNDLID